MDRVDGPLKTLIITLFSYRGHMELKFRSAVILAGGECPPELRQQTGVHHTANLEIGGKRMVEHVTHTFAAAGFGHIYVVGNKVEGFHHLPDAGSFVGNLRQGIAEADRHGTIYVSTCDLPFLGVEEIDSFSEQIVGSSLCCSVVPMECCRRAFPDVARTALTTAEGEFTLGNIVAGEGWVWRHALPIVERAFRLRKNKLGLAWMMGPRVAINYARAKNRPDKLKIAQLERRASKMIRVMGGVRAVIGDWPGIGTDVDTLEHYLKAQDFANQLVEA